MTIEIPTSVLWFMGIILGLGVFMMAFFIFCIFTGFGKGPDE